MPCKSAHTKNSSCRISLSSCKLRGLCMYHDFKKENKTFHKAENYMSIIADGDIWC